MRIDIATLFPQMCQSVMQESIIGRAKKKELFELYFHQIRDYTQNKQKQVDDYPYGGGCGMVMNAQPIYDCCMEIVQQNLQQGRERPYIIFMTACGKPYTQQIAKELAQKDNILLVCGHYEGIDQRVIDELADCEISIGDYVLTGGELPALVVADSVLRLQPGVLSDPEGYQEESHWNYLLEYPQYTRPEIWREKPVPSVLLSGHHANIQKWRQQQSWEKTKEKRPDLWEKFLQENPDINLKKEIKKQQKTV